MINAETVDIWMRKKNDWQTASFSRHKAFDLDNKSNQPNMAIECTKF